MNGLRRGFQRTAFVVSIVLALAAAARGQTATDQRVVWYVYPGARAQAAPALAAWTRLHPEIAIDMIEIPGTDAMERVRTEQRAHHVVADLLTLGDIGAWPAAAENLFQPFSDRALPNIRRIAPRLRPFLDPQRRMVPMFVLVYGIIVNTQVLPEASWPHKWTDLLRPEIVSRLGIHDSSVVGAGLVWYMIGEPVLGDTFFHQLVAAHPRVYARGPEEESAINSGERAVIAPAALSYAVESKGAPTKFIAPDDGIFFITSYTGVVRDAPHPDAAQMFLNFLLGPEFQRRFADVGQLPVVPQPGGLVDIGKVRFLGSGAVSPANAANIGDALKAGQALMGK